MVVCYVCALKFNWFLDHIKQKDISRISTILVLFQIFFYLNKILNISGIIDSTRRADHILEMPGLGKICDYCLRIVQVKKAGEWKLQILQRKWPGFALNHKCSFQVELLPFYIYFAWLSVCLFVCLSVCMNGMNQLGPNLLWDLTGNVYECSEKVSPKHFIS